VNDFLKLNYLELTIREHQCAENGIDTMFENKLVTFFLLQIIVVKVRIEVKS
jgi:hypothetical protein